MEKKKMKKALSLLLALLISLLALSACNGGDNTGGENDGEGVTPPPASDTAESVIYSETEIPTLIFADSILLSADKNNVYKTLTELIGTAPDTANGDSVEQREHEIIFGRSSRALSEKAYRKLDRENRGEDNIGFVILTDGESIAVAYSDDGNNISAKKAVNYLMNEIIKDNKTLTLDKNTVHSQSFSLVDELKKEDAAVKEAAWDALLLHLGDEYGPEIVSALREHYALYSSEAITWFASLYDPGVGSFYHSNSGRDTYGYLPDVESTAKILAMITASGMLRDHSSYVEVLPEDMKQQIGDFIYNLQDPDGFFYHPQWETVTLSRRGRDLSWSTDILKKLGRTPKYSTITGVQGEDVDLDAKIPGHGSVTTAVSKVVAAAAVPDHLKSEEAFKAYLESLNIRENSYERGNDLSSQGSQIRAQGLGKVLIEFLNENQFEENGLWHAKSDYYGINGLMKISGIYSSNKVAMPNADKAINAAIDAILSDEKPGSVVSFYNPWAAVTRIIENQRKYGGEEGNAFADEVVKGLMERAPEAIRVTTEKVARHKREDGSFSYYPDRSVHVSQKAPVCVPYTVESDVAGACISITGVTGYIFTSLEIEKYRVPIYGKADLKTFIDTINALTPIVKEAPEPEPLDFEDDTLGEKPSGFSSVSMKSDGSSATVVEANGSNVVKLVSNKGAGDALVLKGNELNDESIGFTFSGKFAVNEVSAVGTKQNAFLRFEFYDKGGHAYRIVFFKDGDKIRITDASANTNPDAKFTEIATVSTGEWIDLKLEYTKGDKNTFSVKIYVNGNLITESHNYFDESGTLETPYTGVTEMKIFSWVNAASVVLMDDLYFYGTNE